MDAALAAAAQALWRGDPLFALKQVALRKDAQALALRATALAQLGEYKQAKLLFAKAARRFRSTDPIAEARCMVALAEVALAAHEITLSEGPLLKAIDTLEVFGDGLNARYAQLLRARHALALGELNLAEERLRTLDLRLAPPAFRAAHLSAPSAGVHQHFFHGASTPTRLTQLSTTSSSRFFSRV
jgi:tetratricopeptide (TPR) repeat protein